MATLPHPCFQKNKAKNVSEKIYTKKKHPVSDKN
jgi:hypothetical protein